MLLRPQGIFVATRRFVQRNAKRIAPSVAATCRTASSYTSRDNYNTIPDELPKPASSSYFTDNPIFNDTVLSLQDLINRYQTVPTLPPDQVPRSNWLSADRLKSTLGVELKSAQYRQIVQLLNRLNSIESLQMPMDVSQTLLGYQRISSGTATAKVVRTLDEHGRAYAIGRRKEASARIWVVKGGGQIFVNAKTPEQFFQRIIDAEKVRIPLRAIEQQENFNVWAIVKGGGPTGQAEAIAHGITKALLVHNNEWKPDLRKTGFVTRNPAVVERKKPGQAKARKKYTWVKR